jgi:hypothetical protein
VIPQADVDALLVAFQANTNGLGVGLYHFATGGIGHQGLADALGITNNNDWRGFIITSDGRFAPTSHFNLPDGSVMLRDDLAAQVQQALRRAGLIP